MKNWILDIIVTFLTGLAGGTALTALLALKAEENKTTVRLSKKRVFIHLFFGICGAFFFGPVVVEYFELRGGSATTAGFICAFLANIILEILSKIADTISSETENIVKRKFKKWFGYNDNDSGKIG